MFFIKCYEKNLSLRLVKISEARLVDIDIIIKYNNNLAS